MLKKLLLFLLTSTMLIAGSFNFTEFRYSDATGKSTFFDGQITFLEDGLKIYYPKTKRLLNYQDDILLYMKEDKEVELGSSQAGYIMKYFEILILLHHGDESSLLEMFEVDKSNQMTLLKPTGSAKRYIDHIELEKIDKQLSHVKLYLKNKDYITINIDDEIR